MKRTSHTTLSVLAIVLAAQVPLAAGAAEVVEGRLTQIMQDHVTVDGIRSFEFDPRAAQCFDFRGDQTTCETLIGIGYADKARVTVDRNVVKRIDIVELQQ